MVGAVVLNLGEGPKRFSGLRELLHHVTPGVLTYTLRGMERDGMLTRTVFAEVPARVEYELPRWATPCGLSWSRSPPGPRSTWTRSCPCAGPTTPAPRTSSRAEQDPGQAPPVAGPAGYSDPVAVWVEQRLTDCQMAADHDQQTVAGSNSLALGFRHHCPPLPFVADLPEG
jgi:hypothetical protein